ncbi:MAG: MotA/TolQ/ExbB proton channel family protein [Ruminiclostridium sp.]|nr:MotA/TolQ/ExbB proton channel family protein [Ruminiclostridium sp.]
MNIFSVIFMNFFGFDILIFLAAVFNGFVYYMVKVSSDKLRGKMSHTIYVPHFRVTRGEADRQVAELREEDVLELRNTSDRFYSLFVNITGIFPLLGILGTVVSLLGLVSDMENVTGNFYGALTSTFWGLIFAIIFKFLDGMISPVIESNEKSVRMYLETSSAAENAANAAVKDSGAAAAEIITDVTVIDDTEDGRHEE